MSRTAYDYFEQTASAWVATITVPGSEIAVRLTGQCNRTSLHVIRQEMRWRRSRKRSRILRGALAGAIGGVAGAAAMSIFARIAGRWTAPRSLRSDLSRLEARQYVSGSAQELDSIGAAADWVDARLLRHTASPRQKGIIAAAAHYGAGAGLGAIYGATAEVAPVVTSGWGVPVAVAESAVMESGLSTAMRWGGPRGYTMRDHVQSALDHGVYGLTVELVRRSVRKAA